jgi:hypothetical protein
MVRKMNNVKYITNERGKKLEVILPIKQYEELIEIKDLYEEKIRVLDSIRCGAEEILKDRLENNLNLDLSEFIDEIEDYSN